jgi:hypothetical protein
MTLQQLAKEKALDIVFKLRPNLPTDWDTVMSQDSDDDHDGFGDGFVIWYPYKGYNNNFICITLQFLYEDLFSMAQYAIDRVYELASKELANNGEQ